MTSHRAKDNSDGPASLPAREEAELHLHQAVREGRYWYLALLEAMALWTLPEETYGGRRYRYLIGGEAFDWILLAERLCLSLDSLVPEQERLELLFLGRPPLELSPREFADLLGPVKYSAYLNYLYGVVVEEALQLAVMEEVEKGLAGQVVGEAVLQDEAFRRIYQEDWTAMFRAFRSSAKLPWRDSVTLVEMKEFLYWLFKYRLSHCEPARVASDTRKGLNKLDTLRRVPTPGLPLPINPASASLLGVIDR